MNNAQKMADRPLITRPRGSQPTASRRVGYSIAVVINAVLLYLINRSPGWEAVPFLTDDTPRVLGLVNASLIAGVVANALYLVCDPRWLRALGDIVTTSIGLAALVGLWNVFPFSFAAASVDWELVARWVIAVAIGGSLIGLIVSVGQLVRALIRRREPGEQ